MAGSWIVLLFFARHQIHIDCRDRLTWFISNENGGIMGSVFAHYWKTESHVWSGHTELLMTETVRRGCKRLPLFSVTTYRRISTCPTQQPKYHSSEVYHPESRFSRSVSKIQGKHHFYLFFTVNTLIIYSSMCSQKCSLTFWKENAVGTAHSSWKKPSPVTWEQPQFGALHDPSSAWQCEVVGSLGTAPGFSRRLANRKP